MDFFNFAALTAAGLIIGTIDTVMNSGSLMMAALFPLFGLSPLHTIATMRVATLLQEFSASINFARKKLINWRQVLQISALAFVGAFVGASIVLQINEQILTYIVGVIMLVLLTLLPEPKNKGKGFQLISRIYTKILCKDDHCVVKRDKHKIPVYIISLILGIYGGFYGAAVGTMFVAMFLLIGSADPLESSAASKVISFFLSLSASYVFYSSGYIVLPILIPISLGAALGTVIGVELAEKVNRRLSLWFLYIVITASAIKLMFFS